jgi:8-oxo-dGTP pyrophosphatase MutT (NUDIX family)
MSTFNLPDTTPAVPVKLTEELSKDQLLTFPAFKTWLSTLKSSLDLQKQDWHSFHSAPYALRSITVQSCDFFGGGRLGFVKLRAEVSNDAGEKLPGSVFLRGGSVAMLLVLQPEDAQDTSEEYVILTVQPRIPAGSLAFVELPAGMLDDSGTFKGAAAKEIKQEVGLEIQEKELVDMTKLANQRTDDVSNKEKLRDAVYPSPGGSDEFIPVFLVRKGMSRNEIEGLKGKLTGLRDHGEKITLRLCRLDDLWKVAARDGKTLAAVALFEGLRRAGMI